MRWNLVVIGGVVCVLGLLFWGCSTSLPEQQGKPFDGNRVVKTEAEWRALLSPEAFEVTRQSGTERPFTGSLYSTKDVGQYDCVCCGQPLFDSHCKYDSGTGWPSFYQPLEDSRLTLRREFSLFGIQMEVLCSRCDAHLGHVFTDGPDPTGLRYCINSAALDFRPSATKGDARVAP